MSDDKSAALPVDQPDDYALLSEDVQLRLQAWIAEHIDPGVRPAPFTSYWLKHEFEKAPAGRVVTHGEFKGAMRAAGYTTVDPRDMNWRYRIRYRP